MNKGFIINNHAEIAIEKNISSEILRQLWNGFTFGKSVATFVPFEKGKISIGKPSFIPLDKDDEYTICIKESGVGICGRDEKCLIRGFMMFMMCIEQKNVEECIVPCRDIHGKFNTKNRMVHLCIFPETSYETIKRQIRLCGVLQYTHIIIEFWGTLKYNCLKELSWPCSFEKDEIRKFILEIRGMGMEPIPMFNHLGHASQCRIKNGKHAVLDQNAGLSYLFTPDGWAWNLHSEEVHKLLRNIRKELYELFGQGKYVHLGCDEAHIFSRGYISKRELGEYFGKITKEAVSEGRIPIIWGDMIVSDKEAGCVGKPYYCAKIETTDAELIRASIAPETIIADWQYNIKEGKIKTSVVLKEKGYKVIICPWYDSANIQTCVNTAYEEKLFGVMQTMWHTFSDKLQSLLFCARKCGLSDTSWSPFADIRAETATLLRKVSDNERTYEECGFTAHQIGERNLD